MNKTHERAKKERDAIIARLTDTQYYCEYCEQVFEYRYSEQYGCEQCNHAILDNNVVEMME